MTLARTRLDPQSRLFAGALVASALLHLGVLSIQFQLPERTRMDRLPTLDVVIVNSRTKSKPVAPQVLAQANLDGGGNTDENRRARSNLPSLREDRPGNLIEVEQVQQRVAELEQEQRQLLTQVQSMPEPQALASAPAAPAPTPAPAAPPQSAPRRSAADLRASALAMVRSLEAQVSKRVDEYNKRPKKTFVGARASEYRFAQYVEDWRLKIERIGNLNYPDDARGRLYGSLRMSVSINADGSLAAVDLDRSSGHPVLDRAAERIVRMGAPYAGFPDNIRRDTDILVITRTWHFVQGDKLFSD
ncbi:MAG: TonB family protein [Burkholderiales bacterium]|nr:TonB family protein [Burkholderiales bacterium]